MRPDSHEIYGRRRSRNLGLGLMLGAFVLLIFAVTIVKLSEGAEMRGFDHTYQTAARRRGTEAVARPGSNRRHRPSRSPRSCGGDGRRELRRGAVLLLVLPGDRLRRHHRRRRGAPAPAVVDRDGDGALRRQHRARHALGVPPEAAVDDAAARRDRARLLRGLQPDRPADRRAGGLQRRAVLGRAATSTRSPASASSMQVLAAATSGSRCR